MATSSMLSIKVAFMSGGVLLTALMLKLSLPVLIDFLNYELPLLWSIAVSWMRPPFLYLLLNCIIFVLVVSSKLQPPKSEVDDGSAVAPQPVPIKVQECVRFPNLSPIKPLFDRIDASPVGSPVVFGYVDDLGEVKACPIRPAMKTEEERLDGSETEADEFVVSRSSWMPTPKRDLADNFASGDKPLVSQRFSNRKSVKSSPEGGKARLGVSKPKRHDTLESTWRTITDGRPVPLTRHLKKSETMDPAGRGARPDSSPAGSPAPVMKKAETFKERSTTSNSSSMSPSPGGGGSGRTRREPTLSHDELNRRVEAFIRKFNEDMRLQRQESLSQYREMVRR